MAAIRHGPPDERGQVTMMEEEKKRVAHHEAGHAVLSHLQGIPVGRVTIAPGGDYYGEATNSGRRVRGLIRDVEKQSRRLDLDDIHAEMKALYAGAIAQEIFTRKAVSYHDWSFDQDAIGQLAFAVAGSSPQAKALIRRLEFEVRQSLLKNWYLVRAVALKLVERETLTSQEVTETIRQNMRSWAE